MTSTQVPVTAARGSLLARPGWHIAAISLGIFLAALDQTVVVTALPAISNDLSIPATELDRAAWVVTAYLLGYTIGLPIMGRVADIYGQRRIYLLSLGLFVFGSLLCALTPANPISTPFLSARIDPLAWLIAGRAVQAVGGGAMLPIGMGMAAHLFAARRVPFVLGLVGAVAEAGGVIGPLWGAIVMTSLGGTLGIAGWRWIFWVNIPLGLIFGAVALLTPALPRSPGKVDWPGGLLLGLGLLSMSLGLSTPGSSGALLGVQPAPGSGEAPLVTPQAIALMTLAVLFFVLFAAWQRRASDPLFPRGLFTGRNKPFLAANLTNILVGAALIVTMVNVPLYVATVLDGSAQQGGLMLLRMTAFIPVGAVAGGLFGVRGLYRWVAVAGLVVAALAFWLMSGWTVTSVDEPLTWLGLALNGVGFGLLISPVTATALQWGGEGRAAFSASSVNLTRMVGMLASLSALTALGLRYFQSLMASHPAVVFANPGESQADFARRQAEYIAYYKWASLQVYSLGFLCAGALCLLAIIFAAWLRRNPGLDGESAPIF